MSVLVEVPPWGQQPREGERAYAAFLAFRDLGPFRTHEATRQRLGKAPGYLKPIERWSARCDWRRRARDWDAHLQAERDAVAGEEAAKWERRRLQALEEGWQTCRALRARLDQLLALPPEAPAVAPPEPAPEMRAAPPDTVATPEPAKATAKPGAPRWNELSLARLAKLVVEMEWALINVALPPPMELDPLTATIEELQSYLARHPRRGRIPPR